MRAWQIMSPTGPEGLKLVQLAEPEARGREVLVSVEATALNRADLLQTLGRYPVAAAGPAVPGIEFAGRVLALGPEARRFAIGDPVMGLSDGGAFAERLAVDERLVLARPANFDLVEAGAFPEAFLTAFDAIRCQGELSAGEVLLIHAAGSGVGSSAIAIARIIGAEILATASPAKEARLLEAGAHRVFDSRVEDLEAQLLAATGDRGVDVVLDLLGASVLAANLRVATLGARIVVIGLLGGARAELDLGLLMKKRALIRGSLLRPRSPDEKGSLIAAFEQEMGSALAAGKLRPTIHAVHDFESLPAAFAAMQRNENFGKIAVVRA